VIVESAREIDGQVAFDPLLHHVAVSAGVSHGADRSQPLVHRQQPALDHGYDLSRRRMPCPDRPRTRQFHDSQAHGVNLIRRAPGEDSVRLRRKLAAWDDDFLPGIVAQ